MNIIMQIPDGLVARLGLDSHDLERQALEALVLESYRVGRMTRDDLCEALGFDASDQLENFLEAHGVGVIGAKSPEKRTVTVSAEEYARLKRRDRQVNRVEDLPEDITAQMARVEMHPRHDHLNDLLKDWTP